MWRAIILACAVALGATVQANAQTTQQPAANQILVIDSEQLFNQSQFGRRVALDLETQGRVLAEENRRIEAELAEEEQELTQQRASLEPEEFRVLADAFDQKVQETRKKQLDKTKALNTEIDTQRLTFLNAAAPILQDLMREAGAAVLLERRNVVLSVASSDITLAAITRIDSVLGIRTRPPETSGE
jgi:Skp family chaperone for outer membrane proteins